MACADVARATPFSRSSVRRRCRSEPLKPSARIGQSVLALTNAQYIEWVDWSGRQIYPGKRGKIQASEPHALAKLGIATQRWEHDVRV